jgi:hypothetical protein
MIQIVERLTRDSIYNRLDSIEIFKKYCKNFHKLDKLFKSEFRDEKKGSCMISWIHGDFYLKDFGGNGWRPIGYVMHKFGLTWNQALAKINDDFCLGLEGGEYNENPINHIDRPIYQEKQQSIIRIKKREWRDYDIEWWGKYGITLKTLKLFNVVAISHFSINDKVFIADTLAYSYNFYWDTPTHYARKVYQPLNKEYKWFGCGGGVVQGEGVLPYKNHLLVISSSLKDSMVWYEMGINSVSPPSENSFLSEAYFNKQKLRFDTVILNFDNDTVGINRSRELSNKYGLKYILTPEKDLSDTVKLRGFEKTREIIMNIINDLLNL